MNTLVKLTLAGLFTAALASPAIASEPDQLHTYADPYIILEIAQSFGPAELDEDDQEIQSISGHNGDFEYVIFFLECHQNTNCTELQFYSYWLPDTPVSNDTINKWNSDYRFGRGYLDDDNDPVVEYDINLDGGVTSENLRSNFELAFLTFRTFDDVVIAD